MMMLLLRQNSVDGSVSSFRLTIGAEDAPTPPACKKQLACRGSDLGYLHCFGCCSMQGWIGGVRPYPPGSQALTRLDGIRYLGLESVGRPRLTILRLNASAG